MYDCLNLLSLVPARVDKVKKKWKKKLCYRNIVQDNIVTLQSFWDKQQIDVTEASFCTII